MVIWAAALGVSATIASYVSPPAMARLFLHGEAYRKEMFLFVMTGQGTEGDIRAFLPQHLLHAVAFCALALALRQPPGHAARRRVDELHGVLRGRTRRREPSTDQRHGARLGALGVDPHRELRDARRRARRSGAWTLFHFEYRLRDQRRWLAWAFAGLAADVLLKWALAPWWRGPHSRRRRLVAADHTLCTAIRHNTHQHQTTEAHGTTQTFLSSVSSVSSVAFAYPSCVALASVSSVALCSSVAVGSRAAARFRRTIRTRESPESFCNSRGRRPRPGHQ